MPSKAEKYFEALLALSGDPLFTQSRQDLLARISDDDLEELVKHSFARQFSRRNSEKLVTTLLDIIAEEKVNDGLREVIKMEADDGEEGRLRLPARGSGQLSSMLRTPAPPPGGVAMRGRKRMLSQDATTEATKQQRLRADGNVGVVTGTDSARAFQAEQQPAPALDVANDIRSEVNSRQRQRSTSSLTELQTPTMTPDREEFVPDIEMVVWIPDGEHSTWKTMTALPHHLSTDLQYKVERDYNDTPKHTTNYRRMFQYQDRNVETGLCANYFVIHKTRRKVTWDEADGNSNRACDHCIRSRRLCARLVNINSTIKFAIFPLPERLRAATPWDDVEYWVQERRYEVSSR